jgi:hypothetical protein
MRRPLAAAIAALALTGVAGCGGSSNDTASVTTGPSATTPSAPAVTTPGTVDAPSSTAPTTTAPATRIGADHLPAVDALSGVAAGKLRHLADAQAFVDALYKPGDPTKPVAAARLEGAGFAGAALRDQQGQDPTTGIAVFRTYAFKVRDHEAAQAEVDAAVKEVEDAASQQTSPLPVSGVPGARGLRVQIDQNGVSGEVTFVTFAAGAYVFGLQGVSAAGASQPQDEIIKAARDLYEKVTAAP